MQRHHTGSGRRRVIPVDWSAHHRPLLAGTRDATVTLRRPGGTRGAFDPATGTYPDAPFDPYFTGPARIQAMPRLAHDQLVADQQVSTHAYDIYLDHALAGVQLDDELTVTAVDDNADAELVDRTLVVVSIEHASLHWQRHLVCVDDLETQMTTEEG